MEHDALTMAREIDKRNVDSCSNRKPKDTPCNWFSIAMCLICILMIGLAIKLQSVSYVILSVFLFAVCLFIAANENNILQSVWER